MGNATFKLRAVAEGLGILAIAAVVGYAALSGLAPRMHGGAFAFAIAIVALSISVPTILLRRRAWGLESQGDFDGMDFGRRRYSWGLVAAVMLIGTTTTVLLTRWMAQDVEKEAEAHFERLAERLETEISRRMMRFVYGLNAMRGVFVASQSVDRGEFHDYATFNDVTSEYPGAIGMGYIERVKREDVERFVAAARADGAPDFEVRSRGDAPSLYVIKYLEPHGENADRLGLDLGEVAEIRDAAERSMRTGQAVITGHVELRHLGDRRMGFLCMLPIYRNDLPRPTTDSERVERLAGWVYMPILADEALANLLHQVNRVVDVEIFDGRDASRDSLIYDADKHLKLKRQAIGATQYADRMLIQKRPIHVGGREWMLLLSTRPSFSMTVDWIRVYASAAVGLLLTSLLGGLVWSLGNARARAIELANSMTSDLRHAKESAESANRSKSEFLANMSHEIRTPMTAILGYADLLLDPRTDSQSQRQHVDTIRRNGEHLLTIINDILDLSKIEANRLSIESVACQPGRVLCDILSLMRVKAESKGLHLEATCETEIPFMVESDPTRLRQILVNLIGNAIKFTKDGGVMVHVAYDSTGDGELRIRVEDTGIGMSPDQRDRLFNAFEQGDTSSTRRFGGAGLGLQITRRLLELLGGRIEVSSHLECGSVFTVWIPARAIAGVEMIPAGRLEVVVDDPSKTAAADAKAPPDDAGAKALEGVRIFLAEDGKDNQRLITFHLRKAGAIVTGFENGRLALEALTVDGTATGALLDPPPCDMILTDMQMPDMDGYELASTLRANGCMLPIIALTAHAMAGDAERCKIAGCDEYATKPIDKAELIRVCRQWARHVELI